MEDKYKKLLEELSVMEEENLTVSEAENKIRTMLYEHANIAVSKASTMSTEEILNKFHSEIPSNCEVSMGEIQKRISKLIGGK